MKNAVSRRFRASVAAAAVGVSLVVGLGACSSGASHNESTTQVCTDLQTQYQQMQAGMLAALGTSLTDPTQASAADQQKMVATIKSAVTALAKTFRDESGKASDSNLSKALSQSADELDGANGKLSSVNDLQSLDSQALTALNPLSTYCPNAGFNE
jgi:hypothetical protein